MFGFLVLTFMEGDGRGITVSSPTRLAHQDIIQARPFHGKKFMAENERFDALLEAMLTKPPLEVSAKEPPADEGDVREPDEG
tara:strand:+ start:4818 stop:5063 length:246 start_codon:yes stop_codon:yes gene_type:complete